MINRGYKNYSIHTARAKWLGKQATAAMAALTENDLETLNQIYEETITALHFKFYPAQQLQLPLPAHNHTHNVVAIYSQLKLWAA